MEQKILTYPIKNLFVGLLATEILDLNNLGPRQSYLAQLNPTQSF